jgi:hypothetical protein
MTAVRKIQIEQEPVFASVARAPAAKLYVVSTAAAVEAPKAAPGVVASTLKNIALFLVSPFIGLAYIVALPFVGFGMLAVIAVRVAAKYEAVRMLAQVLKSGALFLAAPVIGLAYIVLFPILGLAALAWMGGRAAFAGHGAELR